MNKAAAVSKSTLTPIKGSNRRRSKIAAASLLDTTKTMSVSVGRRKTIRASTKPQTHVRDAQQEDIRHANPTLVAPPVLDAESVSNPGSLARGCGDTFSAIGIYAAAVDDIERTRISLSHRAKAFVRQGAPEDHPDVLQMLTLSREMEAIERKAIKRLEHGVMHETPLGPWVQSRKGIGLKTVGRFLGCVGDPCVRPIRGEATEVDGKRVAGPIVGWQPRTVSALWAYCGLDVRDGKAPRRAKGMASNWNTVARKRAYCMAEPCVKIPGSAYRHVYDAARLKYAEVEIADGHKHNRAIRVVMKAIVKDIWIESRRAASTTYAEAIIIPTPLAKEGE